MVVIDESLSYELKDDHIHFVLSGQRTYESILKWWSVMASVSKNKNCNKILVENKVFGKLSPNEVLDIMIELEHMGFNKIILAVIDNNLDNKEINEYAHTIAQISGFHSKMFRDVEEAGNWLKSTQFPSTE